MIGVRYKPAYSTYVKLLDNPLVLGKLLAVIGCQRADNDRKRRQQSDHRIRHRRSGFERHMGNQRVTGGTFVEGHQCPSSTRTWHGQHDLLQAELGGCRGQAALEQRD